MKWTVIGVLALIFLVAYFNLVQQIEIDSCLDAGGSYDYEVKVCNFE